MKSVLVIDTPTYCGLCPCFTGERFDVTNQKAYYDFDERPDWCPLRPLPKKMKRRATDEATDLIYSTGWNDCLAEMMGETE